MSCQNESCRLQGTYRQGNVVLHGYSRLKKGRRRRYRCKEYGKTFGATAGTPYKRIQHTMRKFDRVAALSVEGVCKSAIARLEGLSWNTVARWQALAAAAAGKFSDVRTWGYDLTELQLDELATFLQGKKRQTWVFTVIEALVQAVARDLGWREDVPEYLAVRQECGRWSQSRVGSAHHDGWLQVLRARNSPFIWPCVCAWSGDQED